MRSVGIAGIGGIGSNVAVHLVRNGFSGIKIADFDKVDESNLNRQFYFKDQIGRYKVDALEENLKRIDPGAVIEKELVFLEKNNIKECFSGYDIIVEGFDSAENKSMIVESFADTEKTVVSACGVAGLNIGNITVRKYFKNISIAGDFITDANEAKLYSPKIFIVASIMADIVIKELMKNKRQCKTD